MIKSLALKVEALNYYCTRNPAMTSSTKEVCFEVQFQFVEFFTTSIKAIRTAGETMSFRAGKLVGRRLILVNRFKGARSGGYQRQFGSTADH